MKVFFFVQHIACRYQIKKLCNGVGLAGADDVPLREVLLVVRIFPASSNQLGQLSLWAFFFFCEFCRSACKVGSKFWPVPVEVDDGLVQKKKGVIGLES